MTLGAQPLERAWADPPDPVTIDAAMAAARAGDAVTIVTQLFYPELRQSGQTMTDLAIALAEAGVQVEVIAGPPTTYSPQEPWPGHSAHRGVRIDRVWGTRCSQRRLLGKTVNQLTFVLAASLKLLRDPRATPLLVLTNPPFLGPALALVGKLRPRPFVYLIFDLYPDTAVNLGVLDARAWLTRAWHAANARVFRHADKLLVIGRCMQARVAERLEQATALKLQRIDLWVDSRAIRARPKSANRFRERWGLAGKTVALYAGNLGRAHDFETLLCAAEALKPESHLAFVFVGDGPRRGWLTAEIARRDLRNCQVHDYVPAADLPELLACADLGLVTLAAGQAGLSVPSKALGLMAAGIPVIGVLEPESEIAQTLAERECGVSVRPGEWSNLAAAVRALDRDSTLRARLGQNGQACVAERFDVAISARVMRAVLAAVTRPSPTRPKTREGLPDMG